MQIARLYRYLFFVGMITMVIMYYLFTIHTRPPIPGYEGFQLADEGTK